MGLTSRIAARFTPRRLASLLVVTGTVLIALGVGLVSPPAGIVVAGVALVGLGLDELRR